MATKNRSESKQCAPQILYAYKCKFDKGERCKLGEYTGICENVDCIHHAAMTRQSEDLVKMLKRLWATSYTEREPVSPYVRRHHKHLAIGSRPASDIGNLAPKSAK